ncbi:MAG: WD40 repeat domain-containing protein [Acidobacteriaceae bacterium]
MSKTRFRSTATRSWRALALFFLALLLLAPAAASAFSLGRVGAFFGIEPGSRLAKPYAVLKESFYPSSVAWSADGRYLADTGILTLLIHIWDMRTKRRIETLNGAGFNSGYHAMAWSPDGRYLAVCTNTKTLDATVWNTQTWQVAAKLPRPPFSSCESLAFDSTSQHLAVGTGPFHSTVQVYATTNWVQVAPALFRGLPRVEPTGFGFSIIQIAFRPHAEEIAIGVQGYFPGDRNAHARVIFWHLEGPPLDLRHAPTGSVLFTYRQGGMTALAYNPAGTQLATGTYSGGGLVVGGVLRLGAYGGSARLWDATSHRLLGAPLDGHDFAGENDGLAYTTDGRYLIVGHSGHSGEIDFIDARTFKVVDTLHAYHLIGAIAVDPLAPMFVATVGHRLLVWSIR